ncbi:MAG: histidine--tRNA ligase [Candidatus Omnitrophota bacterium]
MFKRIPGTKDILPSETPAWQTAEAEARRIFSLYNYQEIRTPIIEEASLFNRTLGSATEIVQKQMFLIHNQENLYALRPEGTASIVRSYLENNLEKTRGFQKLYYIGPMFRFERPQKGRLRQFHHIGAEAIGSEEADLDVEIISLAAEMLKNFGISGHQIKINSLGCPLDKKKLSDTLKKELSGRMDLLCPDCRTRAQNNILRVLDCKNDSCRQIVKDLGLKEEYLCPDCHEHFAGVKRGLEDLGIPFKTDPRLVRGLDYYNRTVFEISHDGLGSQDAIGAGGRYNNLVHELGGPEMGAAGFAFGVERLLLVPNSLNRTLPQKLVYLVTLGKEARRAGIKILNRIRNAGIPADIDYLNKSLKGALRSANDAGAAFVLILGEDELKKNSISMKNMSDGSQKEVGLDNLIGELKC